MIESEESLINDAQDADDEVEYVWFKVDWLMDSILTQFSTFIIHSF